MSNLSADVAGIAGFSAVADAMAAQVAAAGLATEVHGPATLGPVFGLIGGDFLAAFAAAHGVHLQSLAQLGATLTSMGAAAVSSAAGYATTDSTFGNALQGGAQ